MKKNLRIASAAAAALLAVAPVAASTVSTVLADTNVTVVGGTTNDGTKAASFKLNVTNALSLANGDPASKLTVTLANPTLPAGASISTSSAKVYTPTQLTGIAANGTPSFATGEEAKNVGNLAINTDYVAFVYVTITGLKAETEYSFNDGAFKMTSDKSGVISNVPVISSSFRLADSTLTGAPYVKDITTGKAVQSGSVDLDSTKYSVEAVAQAIVNKFGVGVTTQAGTTPATGHWTNVKADVRAALKTAGITTKSDAKESFDKPAASFPVTLNYYATNGKTGTIVITVNPSSDEGDATYPEITFAGVKYKGTKTIDSLPDTAKFNYVPVDGVVDKDAIVAAFATTVSATDLTKLTPSVDVSAVNTKVAGKYPVVVSATNADGKTTKVTFMLTVGAKGASYKTVQSDGDVPVYEIVGNNVTDTKTVVKKGDQIAVFGESIKIGDKTYARINSADSNKYIESKYVDGTFKPADKVAKKVMHNAFIYDKDHKRVGTKTLAAYSNVDVYGAATKLADGSLVYQIGDNQYVMADNIDGTVRTLTHNAYVYKTSTKRADRRVLRKGAKVTTYGAPYTFKNGKAYYRIGGPAKQYVKVANF
ncbi:SLAP domain-containing protein [Lactobacillus sp. M0403]|uniref:SLAP domain-containing protein n=1 Tax=unclassified Lactobacillus TaxID=2620435 RepID=UPI0018DCBA68|nr:MULTISPECIES: SLAP domain-containing protein [unclassified Lactobacillus]MBH9985998.1 SLAP domain-containing protein [Lactobacillus sp. M0390]MBI0092359.1 SLAP domain-containing protein [Lactobacillus sp. M0403]